MPYNFAADSFHTKKLCSRLSSSEVRFYTEIGRLAFLRPPLGDLGATYDDHLTLIGKRVYSGLLRRVPKKTKQICFLSELRQMSTNFDNFWQKDGKRSRYMRGALIFHLT